MIEFYVAISNKVKFTYFSSPLHCWIHGQSSATAGTMSFQELLDVASSLKSLWIITAGLSVHHLHPFVYICIDKDTSCIMMIIATWIISSILPALLVWSWLCCWTGKAVVNVTKQKNMITNFWFNFPSIHNSEPELACYLAVVTLAICSSNMYLKWYTYS